MVKMKKYYRKINNKLKIQEKLWQGIKLTKNIKSDQKISIITSSYNCGQFLPKFFETIVNTKEFKNNQLEIIFINDGSSDDTEQIVKRYQANTDLIKYISQENSGQSAARNAGIKLASGQYLTFIDSDDFINKDYFTAINYIINEYNPDLISNNLIFFRNNKYEDNHALRYKFHQRELFKKVNYGQYPYNVQLSASSAIFKSSIIKNNNIEFLNIKPNFEDANFIAQYLNQIEQPEVVNNRISKYYYRKRDSGDSTIDSSVTDIRKYVELLSTGYLSTLQLFGDSVPKYAQAMVLYDLNWNECSYEENSDILNTDQKQQRAQLITEIMSLIEEEVIGQNPFFNDQTKKKFYKLKRGKND